MEMTIVRTYSEKKAAEVLDIPRSTLRLWRNSGRLPASAFLTGSEVPARADGSSPVAPPVAPPTAQGPTRPIAYRASVIDAVAAGGQWPEI